MQRKRPDLIHNCAKVVANMVKATCLRPFSRIILGCLKKKKYLCGIKYTVDAIMVVVTGREFRASQSKYFGFARQGEDVIIKSRAGHFRLIPVPKKETAYDEEKLTKMIDQSMQQFKDGKYYEMAEGETSEDFLNRMMHV